MLGSRLKEFRNYKKLSQEELAKSLNTSKGNISKYETNSQKPGAKIISCLSETYPELNPSWLLNGTPPMLLQEQKEECTTFDPEAKEMLDLMLRAKNNLDEEAADLFKKKADAFVATIHYYKKTNK